MAKVARWLFYTVLFSVAPIAASYILALTAADHETPRTFAQIVGHGELYLLSSTYTAVGVGELIGVNDKWQVYKIINGGMSIFVGVLSIILYVKSNTAGVAGVNLSALSYWMFGASCIIATSCVAVSEVKQ